MLSPDWMCGSSTISFFHFIWNDVWQLDRVHHLHRLWSADMRHCNRIVRVTAVHVQIGVRGRQTGASWCCLRAVNKNLHIVWFDDDDQMISWPIRLQAIDKPSWVMLVSFLVLTESSNVPIILRRRLAVFLEKLFISFFFSATKNQFWCKEKVEQIERSWNWSWIFNV